MARPVRWIGEAFTFQSVGAGGVMLTAAAEADLEEMTQPTVIRMRGQVTMKLNASDGVTYQASSYRIGIIVVHKSAVAGDISLAAFGNPWLYYATGLLWQPVTTLVNGFTGATYGSALGASTRKQVHQIDVKAMRKIDRNSRLVLVADRATEAGAPNSPQVYGHVRVLVKE